MARVLLFCYRESSGTKRELEDENDDDVEESESNKRAKVESLLDDIK